LALRFAVSAIVFATVIGVSVHDAGRPASAAAKSSAQIARECAEIKLQLGGSGQDPGLEKEIRDLDALVDALDDKQYRDRTHLGEFRASAIAVSVTIMSAPEGKDRVLAVKWDDYIRHMISRLEQRIAVRQEFIGASLSVLSAMKQKRDYLKDREAENRCAGITTSPGNISVAGGAAADPVCAQINTRLFGEDGKGGTVAEWRHVKSVAIPGDEYELKVDKKKLEEAEKAQADWLRTHGAPPGYENYSESPWPMVDAYKIHVSRDAAIIEEQKQRLADLARSITADRAALRARGCAERGEAGRPPPNVASAGTSGSTTAKPPATSGTANWIGTWTGSVKNGFGVPGTMTFVITGNNQSLTIMRDVRWSDGTTFDVRLTCQVGAPTMGSGNSRAIPISSATCKADPPPEWSFGPPQTYNILSDGTLDAGPSQLLRRAN
jgi:hypothetical protein